MVLTNSPRKALDEQWIAENDTPECHAKHRDAIRNRVLAYETQFGIPSSDVHDAIDDGRLVETLEVCEWLMDIYVLERSTTIAE